MPEAAPRWQPNNPWAFEAFKHLSQGFGWRWVLSTEEWRWLYLNPRVWKGIPD